MYPHHTIAKLIKIGLMSLILNDLGINGCCPIVLFCLMWKQMYDARIRTMPIEVNGIVIIAILLFNGAFAATKKPKL